MRLIRRTLSGFGVALVLVSLHATPVCAALGGDASTVDADRVRMRGSLLRIVRSDAYTIHEIRSESGTTVREFISPAGRVFAVAWEGPRHPDMEQVLGTYFARYQQGAQAALKQRRPRGLLQIRDGDFVVQVSGHQRAIVGRAYLANDIPRGVQVDALR
jgi:uncharacterized protein DUF2844